MAKGKPRKKDQGRYTKVIVIGGFANDEHLKLYKYVLDKYLHSQVDDLIDITLEKLDDHEALKILEIEDHSGTEIRVEDVIKHD